MACLELKICIDNVHTSIYPIKYGYQIHPEWDYFYLE
jgi:hypothetical protein